MAATAHIITGFIGAGKTTFARKLESQMSIPRLSHDEWMVRHHGRNPPIDKFREYFRNIEGMLWTEALEILASGRDVIIDAGLWTRATRDAAIARVNAIDCRAVLYSVVCPVPIMLQRTMARSEALPDDSLWIDKPAFDKFLKVFEPMQDDEVYVTVDGETLAYNPTEP